MQTITISESPKHVNETVKIGVWLTDKRSSGKIAFLQLRDGTGFFQGILLKNQVTPEVWDMAKHELHQETSFWVTGEIHEELYPVFLIADWVIITFTDKFDGLNLDFVTKLRPRIFMNFTGYPERCFLV